MSATEHDVIDAATGELVPYQPQHASLFRTDDPAEIVNNATQTAELLADIVRRQKLSVTIQGREHVKVEGWTLLGTLLGVFPVCTWTRAVNDKEGWEARVEARTRDGSVVGAAEAECLRAEKSWKGRDDYALRSMAQTRATSKALRLPLGFVMTLAGFDATPAEEMPPGQGSEGEPRATDTRAGVVPPSGAAGEEPASPSDNVISDAQLRRMWTIWRQTQLPVQVLKDLVERVAGVESTKAIPKDKYDALIAEIEKVNETPF